MDSVSKRPTSNHVSQMSYVLQTCITSDFKRKLSMLLVVGIPQVIATYMKIPRSLTFLPSQ